MPEERTWKPRLRACKICGSWDFKNDYQRRAHQRFCKNEKKDIYGKYLRKSGPFGTRVRIALALWYGEPVKKAVTTRSAFRWMSISERKTAGPWPLGPLTPENFPWGMLVKKVEGPHGSINAERFLNSNYSPVEWFREGEASALRVGCNKPLLLVFARKNMKAFAMFRRPVMRRGKAMVIEENHMTFCTKSSGDLVVMCFKNLMDTTVRSWRAAYNAADPDRVLPRIWKYEK